MTPGKCFVIAYTARARAVSATRSLREAFGAAVPIYARALDSLHAAELKSAGATDVVTANVESGLELTARVLGGGGGADVAGISRGVAGLPTLSAGGLAFLTALLRSQMDARTTQMAAQMMSKDGSGGSGGKEKQQQALLPATSDAPSSSSSSSSPSASATAASSSSSPAAQKKEQAAASAAAGAKYDSAIFRLDAGGSASGNAADEEAAAIAPTQEKS